MEHFSRRHIALFAALAIAASSALLSTDLLDAQTTSTTSTIVAPTDSQPVISAFTKSASAYHPDEIWAGLRAYISVNVTDDNGIASASINVPGMRNTGADVSLYQCSNGVKSCSEPVYVLVPDTVGPYYITVKATDTAGQTSTANLTFVARGCTQDSECGSGGTWGGVPFCDGTGLKLQQYRTVGACVSGACSEKSEVGVKEDCGVSAKICDFSYDAGGNFKCVPGSPPTACALNAQVSTNCTCGSGYYSASQYNGGGGYCCGSGSSVYWTSPGPCPSPSPSPTYSPSPSYYPYPYPSPSPSYIPFTFTFMNAIFKTQNSALITWTTSEITNGQVEYGTTPTYASQTAVFDTAMTSSYHNIPLTGLSPATLYHYRVKSVDRGGNQMLGDDKTFSTLAEAASSGSIPLTITSPVAGTQWPIGAFQSVRWSGGEPSWNLDMALASANTSWTKNMVLYIVNNGGLEGYTPTADVPLGQYVVRIYCTNERGAPSAGCAPGTILATSQTFSIVAAGTASPSPTSTQSASPSPYATYSPIQSASPSPSYIQTVVCPDGSVVRAGTACPVASVIPGVAPAIPAVSAAPSACEKGTIQLPSGQCALRTSPIGECLSSGGVWCYNDALKSISGYCASASVGCVVGASFTPSATSAPGVFAPPPLRFGTEEFKNIATERLDLLRDVRDLELLARRGQVDVSVKELSAIKEKLLSLRSPEEVGTFREQLSQFEGVIPEREERGTPSFLGDPRAEARALKQMKQGVRQFERYLSTIENKIKQLAKSGISISSDIKETLSTAKTMAQQVKTAKTFDEITELQEQMPEVGFALNDILPRLEEMARLPRILRLVDRRIFDATRAIAQAQTTAKRLKIDATEQIGAMQTFLDEVKVAMVAVKSGELSGEAVFAALEEQALGNIENILEIAEYVRATANVRSAVNRAVSDTKRFEARIKRQEARGEDIDVSSARDLLDQFLAQIADLRELSGQKLSSDNADQIIEILQALSDLHGELEEMLGLSVPDPIEAQIRKLFESKVDNIQAFDVGQLGG